MIDVTSKKPLRVLKEGSAGPFLEVPYVQLAEVRRVLDANRVGYWVLDSILSVNGGPEMAQIEFGQKGEQAAIQVVLDSVP